MLTSACEAALVFPLLSLTEFFSGAETDSRELSCGGQRLQGDLRSLSALSHVVDAPELQLVAGVGPQTPELEAHVGLVRLHAELHLLTVVRLLVADHGSGDGVTLGH